VPVRTTYPGVYIEEVSSGVHPITGVATSIAAFVDSFARGPTDTAVQIFGFGDFERIFGGLNAGSEASYAIQQFFLNGGAEAWVVRVASGAATATVVVRDAAKPAGSTSLTISAASPGSWGNGVRIRIDRVKPDPDGVFNLTATEYAVVDGVPLPIATEQYLNLVMDDASPNAVDKAVAASSLVRVEKGNSGKIPLPNGLVSDDIGATVTLTTGDPLPSVAATMAGTTATAVLPEKPTGAIPLTRAAALLQSAIRNARADLPVFSGATVDVLDGTRLRVLAGGGDPEATIEFAASTDTKTAGELKLTGAGVVSNVQQYVLGGASVTKTAQDAGTAGTDGSPPNATALRGSRSATPPTGMFAFDKVDLFNILCLPRIARRNGPDAFAEAEVGTVITTAAAYCEERHAMLVVDTPSDVATATQMREWLTSTLDAVRHKNAAAYFPRLEIADPLNGFRPISVGASGTIAGLWARTDAARGVWKAPAGTEASLRNVQRIVPRLTDQENGIFNPLGINCLRTFDVYGNVSWGARTLVGADQQTSEWKYVPVRRLALFLEESLFRGTKWVVFEPNDEPLWAQIRLNVGAFMHDLFRLGAFQGKTPREAYLVKCDGQTTTQTDVDHGIVNIVVGFAPLKPAEFVILRIQQLAGQIEV
jgi:phage tail sheath protein FI